MVIGDINGRQTEDEETKKTDWDKPSCVETEPCEVEGHGFAEVESAIEYKQYQIRQGVCMSVRKILLVSSDV